MPSEFVAQAVPVRCPHCGAGQPVDVTLVVDAELDPRAARGARQGALNETVCGRCGEAFEPDTPLLYLEPGRELAAVYAPPDADDSEALATALLTRRLRGQVTGEPADWWLTPRIFDDRAEFLAALAPDAQPSHPESELAPVLAWLRQVGAVDALRAVEALAAVQTEAAFVETLNRNPALIAPDTVRAVERAGLHAAREEQMVVAELLRDLAAALRLHTPVLPREEPDEEDTEAEHDPVPDDVRDLLLAGDVEAAAEFLERPGSEHDEHARRATLSVQPEEAALREGFTDHARMFSRLVDDLMEPATPDELPEDSGWAEELPGDAFAALLNAPTFDVAQEVLDTYPELVDSPRTVEALQQLAAEAIDRGDDGHATHLEMLLQAVFVAGDDDDPDEDVA